MWVFSSSLELVTHRMIKENAIVIDVGISKSSTDKAVTKNKRFVGDVDFDGIFLRVFFLLMIDDVDYLEVKRVARWITPVPGGVGPVTVACLISNLLKLARQRRQ